MTTTGHNELSALLTQIETARDDELPVLVGRLAAAVRHNEAMARRLLDEAERDAPRYQRRIEALREAHDALEDELERLTTGEVELSEVAAHVRAIEEGDASLISDVRYEDIGVGD